MKPEPMAEVTLPWPPAILHPNGRPHWAPLAKAKAAYRFACSMLTKQAGIKFAADARLHVALEFVPPDRRRRDLDGMLAACKSGLDGLADAIGCDDSRWVLSLSVAPEIGGMVRVRINHA
jgi:crossover junction endodeoxyribonuclease RusA